jgi:hypothetical protein
MSTKRAAELKTGDVVVIGDESRIVTSVSSTDRAIDTSGATGVRVLWFGRSKPSIIAADKEMVVAWAGLVEAAVEHDLGLHWTPWIPLEAGSRMRFAIWAGWSIGHERRRDGEEWYTAGSLAADGRRIERDTLGELVAALSAMEGAG